MGSPGTPTPADRFATLESMMKKYGPEAKVADVIAAEREALEIQRDREQDWASDLAAEVWAAEGHI